MNTNAMAQKGIFMFCEPLSGKRTVEAHELTMTDWAQQIKRLLDVDYPNGPKSYSRL